MTGHHALDKSIFVTLHTDKAVVRVNPTTEAVTPFAPFDTPVAGLAFAADGSLMVSGGTPGQPPGVIWHVTPGGAVSHVADLPEAAFLNGVTPLGGDRFLVADSIAGLVYAVDPADRAVTTWLADPLLAPTDASGTPGASGIKSAGFRVVLARGPGLYLLASCYLTLTPLLAHDVLTGNASGYGTLLGAIGAGSIAGGVVLSFAHRHSVADETLLAACATSAAAALLALSQATSLFVACLALAVVGGATLIQLATYNAAAQLILPEAIRGVTLDKEGCMEMPKRIIVENDAPPQGTRASA